MNSNDWKDLIRKVAPTVASAIGGPLAGVATTALSQIILGKPDATQDELQMAVSNGQLTGEQITEIKKLEMQLKAEEAERGFRYSDLEYKTEVAYLEDRQSARARQQENKDTMPQQIFYLLLFIYVAQQAAMLGGLVPTDDFVRALITRGFGIIETGLIGAIGFFIGSSRGSKTATESLTRIAEAPIAAPSPPAPTTVIQSNNPPQ